MGYGSTFIAQKDMEIAIVSIGYGDGYPRAYIEKNYVVVNGQTVPLVGRVSMDMMAVDLSPVPKARLGSEVTLWGRASNGAVLPIDEVAAAAGTLGYELMCAVAPRVPKQVEGAGK